MTILSSFGNLRAPQVIHLSDMGPMKCSLVSFGMQGEEATAAGEEATAVGEEATAADEEATTAGEEATAADEKVTAAGDLSIQKSIFPKLLRNCCFSFINLSLRDSALAWRSFSNRFFFSDGDS